MLLSIFLTVTVGFTATIGFMMWQWMAQQEVLAKKPYPPDSRGTRFTGQQTAGFCPDCRPGIWATAPSRCAKRGISDRQSLNQLLVHYLSAHPSFPLHVDGL